MNIEIRIAMWKPQRFKYSALYHCWYCRYGRRVFGIMMPSFLLMSP